jgi:hypothetical protein
MHNTNQNILGASRDWIVLRKMQVTGTDSDLMIMITHHTLWALSQPEPEFVITCSKAL